MGIFAASGQWFGVKALRLGEASVIGNIEYTKLIYASILGIILFNEIPDICMLVGASVIVEAAFYIFHRDANQIA